MRILAPNRHDVYFMILAQTGYKIDLLTSLDDESLGWNLASSDLPANLRLVPWSSAVESAITDGSYDAIVLLTMKDFFRFRRYHHCTKLIFMIHIALFAHSWQLKLRWIVKRLLLAVLLGSTKMTVAFSSYWKKSTWRVSSTTPVIPHAPLPTPKVLFNPSTPPRPVTVGNHLCSRPEANTPLLRELILRTGLTVIGNNPGIAGCLTPKSRAAFSKTLCQFQIYVFVVRREWEDGFNLGMLEAMQSGMPVVSLKHPTSPIEDGVSGYLCEDIEEMIIRINFLIQHPHIAEEFGRRSQQIVQERFSTQEFVQRWSELLGSQESTGQRQGKDAARKIPVAY